MNKREIQKKIDNELLIVRLQGGTQLRLPRRAWKILDKVLSLSHFWSDKESRWVDDSATLSLEPVPTQEKSNESPFWAKKPHLFMTSFTDRNGTAYGFRIFDEKHQGYDNLSGQPIYDDIELLKYAFINHFGLSPSEDEVSAVLHSVADEKNDIVINGTLYPYGEISYRFSSWKKGDFSR